MNIETHPDYIPSHPNSLRMASRHSALCPALRGEFCRSANQDDFFGAERQGRCELLFHFHFYHRFENKQATHLQH
jgi:hypothetical protein